MAIVRVTPEEAHRLITESDYQALDVRTVREFEQEHTVGAVNIPLFDYPAGGTAMLPNEHFSEAVAARFDPSHGLVLVCRSGRRSLHAANILEAVGFTATVDLIGGMHGTMLPTEPGWIKAGLEITTDAQAEQTWAVLQHSVV